MRITVTNICRGSGKVFLAVDIDDVPDEALVAFQAYTPSGTPVPMMSFPNSQAVAQTEPSLSRSFDIALPLINIDIELVAFAFAPDGSVIGEDRLTESPFFAKWHSRLNALTNKREVESLRDCDRSRTVSRTVIEIWGNIGTTRERGKLKGFAYVPVELSATPPTLIALDENMDALEEQPLVMSVQTTSRFPNYSAPVWEISFTQIIPNIQALVTIAALDSDGRLIPGFEAYEQYHLDQLRERVAYLYAGDGSEVRYHKWFLIHRTKYSELEKQRETVLPYAPLFSIVVPLYRTPVELFEAMFDSVRAQTYPRWELLLVNASPEDGGLARAVGSACAQDLRVREVRLAGNGGITLNTNEGVAAARGDYVCFFDHDDLLEPDILFEYASALNDDPSIDMLYCDEDKLASDGRYIEPFFKPDFSIDFLRSNNYVCHMLTVRSSMLRQLPKQGAEFDGAQDHNLTLMVSERTSNIRHVAKVLYHWRISETSTAANSEGKAYATQASHLALGNHFKRLGIAARVSDADFPFTYRIDYEVTGDPLVSVVIPNKDSIDLLDRCLKSIASQTTYANYEVVVVENNSTDQRTFDYYKSLEDDERVRVVYWDGTGFNFSSIVNFGCAHAKGDYLLLLNNDTEVITDEWIELMLGACQRPDVGIVGARLLYPDRTVQHAGLGITGKTVDHLGRFLSEEAAGYAATSRLMRNVSAVTGACLMIEHDFYDELGGLDPQLAVAYNDVDLCFKATAQGKLIVYNPFAVLIHYESISRGSDVTSKDKQIRFFRENALLHHRWARLFVEGDPYLNANLTKTTPDALYFALVAPSEWHPEEEDETDYQYLR